MGDIAIVKKKTTRHLYRNNIMLYFIFYGIILNNVC